MKTKLYMIDVRVYGTAYVRATSKEDARLKAQTVAGCYLDATSPRGDVRVSGQRFDDPTLPDVRLSPCMTVFGVDKSSVAERVL